MFNFWGSTSEGGRNEYHEKSIEKISGGGAEEAQHQYLLSKGMKEGKSCHIYSYNGIDGGLPWLITIGDDVTISSGVRILTHDASTNVVGCGTKLGRVDIGNNVFIGCGSIVLCNTKIGDNVVVGAGSVVAHDLESDAVYAGNPARKICTIDEYREKYETLRQSRPRLDDIRPWNTWGEASEKEKQQMSLLLEGQEGFF